MAQRVFRWAWVGVVSVTLGCSGGDAAGDGSGRGAASQSPVYRPNDPTATAGAAAPADPSGFGNSSANPAATAPQQPLEPIMECQVGERCVEAMPDPDDCGSLTLEADVEVIEKPGNVLLVFDRSGSMASDWNGQTRWEAAGMAISDALAPLGDLLTVGSVFFPSSDPNAMPLCIDPTGITCLIIPLYAPSGTCLVNPITDADQINFQKGPDFITSFSAGSPPLYAPIPSMNEVGFTPLKEALQQAQAALAASTLDGFTTVVVITDGEPNCDWDAAAATQIVTDWQTNGIDTYVIGLPGVNGNGPQVLNQLAAAGGTGSFINVADASTLQAQLQSIAMETVQAGFDSCEITLDPPAEAPEKLHLVVTEGGTDQDVARDLADDFKWKISDDGGQVTLEGRLCDDATGGRFSALRFEFGCVDLPPLPPPPPLE